MEQVKLEAKLRKDLGKEAVRRLRKEGLIPAVVYRRSEKATPLVLNRKALDKVLHTAAGENVIINLNIGGDEKSKERTCIIKEIQHDPVTGDILHADFNQILLTEAIKVNVPLSTKGEAVGVKQDGGILEHVLWEIQVECLPTQIPQKLEVDVANLKIGDALFVKDIVAPKGVKILNDPELRIIAVEKPVEIKVEEVKPEEAIAEPEVIKQKKEEEVTEEETGEKGKEDKEKKESK